MATQCGSCHVGGSLPEKGLDGVRHSQRQPDMTMATFNPYNNFVEEKFDSTSGLPKRWNNPFNPLAGVADGFGIGYAMWSMPGTFDNKFTAFDDNGTPADPADDFSTNAVVPGMFVPGANGWIQAGNPMIGMGMAVDGQMTMPNVREMDCLMCHLDGFNNIINSAAVQMGYLNAAPALSSGLMNMFSQTYMPGTTVAAGDPIPGFEAFGAPVKLSNVFLSKIKPEPPTDNCRQCHIPTEMKNMSDMFDKFLSAAPMEYNTMAPNGSLINGMAMPSYDLNSPFVPPTSTSLENFFNFNLMEWVYAGNDSAAGPFGIFPMALDSSWAMFNGDGTPNTAAAGGNRDGMTGPLFYAGASTNDQNALKKGTIPFPRADFFKRGDIWDDKGQEIHYSLGCAGCHYNTNSLNPDLNQCDPGRGRTRMGGVESGQVAIDTHDTVKRCADCHVTGTNVEGRSIETFGAKNPTAAHAAAGLLAMVTTPVVLDGSGNEVSVADGGNHLDVIDCTVCHLYKKSMTVRSLDSTSGNRYPALIGFPYNKGIMGMFTDPMAADTMSDAEAVGAVTNNFMGMGLTAEAVDMYLSMTLYGAEAMMQMMQAPGNEAMMQTFVDMAVQPRGAYPDAQTAFATLGPVLPQYFPGLPAGSTMGDAARVLLKTEMEEWRPIYGWWANMPKHLPGADGTPGAGPVNPNWRRKLIPINFIVAQMWDDAHDNGATDANGDNGESDGVQVSWDPWIARDMKVGMNFLGGPFATIPSGFGESGDPYYSAYDANFNFTGAFQYVGVYGGNIMLTTPGEISGYKAWRESIKDNPGMDGKSWDKTQLVFFGGNPFQVTHNVVDTDKYVMGKPVRDANGTITALGCTDCHAADAGFFAGAYDMTGSGVPASTEYDYDNSGFTFGLDMAAPITNNFMFRHVEDFEVTALKDDLRTGSEAFSKGGTLFDVEFDECLDTTMQGIDCADANAVYRQTHDLGRDEFMYPDLDAVDLAAKITYLTGISETDAGIGVDPVAAIASGPAEVTPGTTASFMADTSGNTQGTFTYSWSFNDGAADVSGTSADKVFTTVGSRLVTLKVTDEEGKTAVATQWLTVKYPAPTPVIVQSSAVTAGNSVDVVFSGLDVDRYGAAITSYTRLVVYWGDGSRDVVDFSPAGTAATQTVAHTYATAAKYRVKAALFKSRKRVDILKGYVTVDE